MICEKCGKEIPENSLVCGFCGHSVPQSQLSNETINRLKEEERSDESLKPNGVVTVRAIGIILMIISGITDVVAMAMIGSGDVSTFSTILTVGSVSFGIGLLLTILSRG